MILERARSGRNSIDFQVKEKAKRTTITTFVSLNMHCHLNSSTVIWNGSLAREEYRLESHKTPVRVI